MADPNIVNPYERIWKTRDLRALEAPIELENNTSQFGRGLNAFGKEMQATGYGLAALGAQGLENVIGENAVTSGITDWGIEGYKKAIDESQSGYNAPNVADAANIKGVGDFTDWASYQLGKGLPMLGTLALSGGVGGAIGRLTAQEGVKQIAKGAVGSAVKKGVETKALQAAEGQIITKAMQETAAKALRDRAGAGAMTGGFAGSFGLEGGLAFGEQVEAGVKPEDAVKSAIAVGGINGALEFLPFYGVAKSIGMGQYAKKSIAEIIKNDAGLSKKAVALATAKELGGRAAKGGLVGAGAEGITEGLQELTSIAGLRWAKQDPLFADLTDEDWNRIGNAMAAGALVGGVAAGAGATLKGPEVTDNATTDTNAPPAGTTAPEVKTREQELEAALAKLTVNLEAAKAAGDTKTIQELQQIKELYDTALGKQKPTIEPVLETPSNEQITQEQPIPGAAETQARPPLEIPARPEGTGGVREEGTGTETGLETREVAQPRPGESIQLKRGEEIVLTPDGTSARTTPTPEEVEALRQRMGPRPERQTTQPIEETANAQEVQAQTETEVESSAIPVQTELEKQAIAIGNDKDKLKERLAQAKSVLDRTTAALFKDAVYDFDNKRLVSKDGNYALQWKIRDNPEEPSSYTNQQTNAGVVSLINVETTTPPVKGTPPLYSKPIGEIKSPNEAIATEATMEEFEAVRRQFQERQSQTPFKKWFGTGTPNVTATKEGEPITLYHGTSNPAFYEWDSTKAGEASGHPTSGLGFFMTADQGAAARYGNNLLALHAKINNPYTLTDADLTRIETPQDAAQLRKRLMSKGYDGAVVTAPGASPYVIAFQANQIKLKSNTNPTDSPDMRYSKLSGTTNVSVQNLQSNIDSIMGQGWLQHAQELGLVEVIEGAGPNGEAGSWAGDRIRLYTDTMPENGSPAGVLLHEGKHVTFEDVLGNSLPEYVKDLHTLADNGNKTAQDAITHAAIAVADVLGIKHNLLEGGSKADLKNLRALIEQERPGLLAEEELAYFVQYGADAQTGTGFWKRLVNQIKTWFAQTRLGQRMKELGIGFELTDAMAVEWAKMGLNRSLAELRQAERQVESVKQNPASVRLGGVLERQEAPGALYSMGIKEITQQLWNDPTDIRPEVVNKPGILQKWRGDFIDFFAEMEKKSKDIYDTYSLLRSKKAARIEQARQEYFLPLRKLIAESPWTAQEVGDMAAARHIKVDKVNTRLAQRASYGYTKELLKALSTTKRKELMQARINVKAGKMPDGKVYLDANGNPAQMQARTKQQLMFDLMNQYSQYEVKDPNGIQVLREEWELFKDAAAGFSDGGVGSTKVRTVDDVLKAADKDRAKFDQIMTLFDAANRHTLEILEDGGLITAAEHARLLLDKSAYAPLRRESYKVDEEIARLFQRAGQGGSKQIATRSGTENLSEPTLVLQNALAAIEAAAAAAERNLANKELYKVVVKDRVGWKPWFTIVEKDKYVTHDEDGFLQEKNATASNRADITLINDGKKLVIRPNMHNERAMGFVRAVNNLDAQVVNGPMKVLGWLNQIVRWVNVSASPIFLMTNAFKDPFTAFYNIKATEAEKYTKEIFSPKTYKDSFRALKKVFMDGNRDPNDPDVQWVEKWELAGGRTSFVETLRDMDETWKSFDAQVSRRKGTIFGINAPGFKSLMEAKDKWIDGIENFNILFENVMRFSTFKVLMEKGAVSEAQAARISQDLTTNFTRRGYKTQALGTWWLFFNATVQGNYQVLRNLMASRKLQAAVGGTVVMALLLDLFGRAVDDDWDKIPEWDKERFIILPIKVAGDFVRIPAPWVYNVVWRTGGLLGEMLSQVKTPQDGLLDIAAMVATTFNPLGKPGSLAQAVSPTGFDPVMQILENKNFAGNPIGPEGFPGASKKANSELMWSSTPPGYQSFARFVNEATGGSAVESGAIDLRPGDYQILVNFLTGSLGRFMADATFGVKEALDKDFEGMRDIPVAKEFFSDPYDPLKSQKYHTNIAGIYGAHKLEQMYIKGPERDLIKLHEVRESRGKELRMYTQAQDVERQLKSLRIRLRTAQNRGDTAREKELRDKIGKIQERFNNVYQQKMG